MTYQESAALMNDMDFRGRCKVAVLKYASSIMIEAVTVPAHNSRYKWAQNTFMQPDLVAMQVQPPTVMDPGVQSAGAAVTDAALQGAVETVVNKMI
jgi:hypothetical protein